MTYVYQPYPKMLYRGPDQITVGSYPEELAREADGWGHTPGFQRTPDPVTPPPEPAAPVEVPWWPLPTPSPRVCASMADS